MSLIFSQYKNKSWRICAFPALIASIFITSACDSTPTIVPAERPGNDASEGVPDPADSPKDVSGDASAIIKRNLKAPGSFQFVSGKTLWRGKMNSAKPQYVVLIGYDAENGFGANLRGCSMVAFTETPDGKLEWSELFGVSEKDRSLCEDESENTTKLAISEAQQMAALNFDSEKKPEDTTPSKPSSIADVAAHLNEEN